jgi:antitoxin component YwqK of YwqJK toxin-antitoxin module
MADTNYVDANGRKQGYWEKRNSEGALLYSGTFRNDEPVGILRRYYPEGGLQAAINYRDSKKAYAKIFYPDNGGLMAEGVYLDQKRDSIWLFYDPDSTLTSKESYKNGLKEGVSILFFKNGSVAEKITYAGDVQNGKWEQFYENGLPKMEATVVNGVSYEGEFVSYYENGRPRLKGKYQDGKKESSWYEYNEDGSIRVIEVYRNGKVADEYPKNGVFTTYYPDDIKRAEYTYKQGKKHGPFKEFYDQGEWKTEIVSDELGENRKVQRLYGTQVQREGKFLEDKLHGEILYYNTAGEIVKRERYEKGELIN